MNLEVKDKLAGFAESVQAQVAFDLKVGFNAYDFWKSKFINDKLETAKLCSVLSKLST